MRTLITLLFWIIATPLGALIAFPWTLISGDIGLLYWIGTRVASAGIRMAGVRVVVSGLDRLDKKKTYIFMSNHASNLDPPILIPLIPRRTSVLVKKELFRIPVLAQAMRIARLVPVERANREQAIGSLQVAKEVLRAGINMTVFVEGTRSHDGRLLPFKKGPFYLAMEAGVPIVPVTIAGTHDLLPKGKHLARTGVARVVFHAPVDPSSFPDKDALMAAVREQIASALNHDH